jgi:hypothetical protein
MEEARIKMVNDPSWNTENVLSGLFRLFRENSILGNFGGIWAMLSKQVSSGSVSYIARLSFSYTVF